MPDIRPMSSLTLEEDASGLDLGPTGFNSLEGVGGMVEAGTKAGLLALGVSALGWTRGRGVARIPPFLLCAPARTCDLVANADASALAVSQAPFDIAGSE